MPIPGYTSLPGLLLIPEHSIPRLEDQFDLPKIDFKFTGVISAPGFECRSLRNDTFSVHPLFLIQQNQIPAKTFQTDIFACRIWLSSKFGIPEDKVRVEGNRKITSTFWNHLDKTLRFYEHIWQKPHMLERVKRFMVAREYAHVQAQRKNPTTFLWWNEYIFSRRNVTCRAEIVNSLFLAPIVSYSFGILSMAVIPPLLAFGIATITALAFMIFNFVNIYVARRQEKEADIHALEITKDKEAAKLFFEALDKSQRESSYTLIRWVFKPIEYLLGDKSLEDRFACLKIAHSSKK